MHEKHQDATGLSGCSIGKYSCVDTKTRCQQSQFWTASGGSTSTLYPTTAYQLAQSLTGETNYRHQKRHQETHYFSLALGR